MSRNIEQNVKLLKSAGYQEIVSAISGVHTPIGQMDGTPEDIPILKEGEKGYFTFHAGHIGLFKTKK